jgi:hypothetical protein
MLAAGVISLLATACGSHRAPVTQGGTTTTLFTGGGGFHPPKHLRQPILPYN